MSTLIIPARFNGPPRSGNGGWVCGALAARLPDQGVGRPVTVTLRQPPVLGAPLAVRVTGNGGLLGDDAAPVAEMVLAQESPRPVEAVPAADAVEAEAAYPGHRHHPFPTCFVCGTAREVGDGLRIFAGPVPGTDRVAASWTPTESDVAITWAALDCPGGWSSDLEGRPSVLGRITVEVHDLPRVGEQHVVVGQVREVSGRKTRTAASLYADDGRLVATAEHVWIAVDPADFH